MTRTILPANWLALTISSGLSVMRSMLLILVAAGTQAATLTATIVEATCPPSSTIWYVDASAPAGGTGTSWDCAFNNLHSAIDASSSGHQIWVKAGVYKPAKDGNGNSNPANARTKTFNLKSGVKLYGGFNGSETLLSQRNWNNNSTTLSGDIGTAGNDTDNCYHVVVSVFDNANTELNGFIVTNGNANGTADLSVESTIVYSYHGGGMYQNASSCNVANCTFNNNQASLSGGAFVNWFGNTTSSITNCIFSGNTCGQHGGGLSVRSCTSTISNCIFNNNSSVFGSLSVKDDAHATISNCLFSGNLADVGAGFYIQSTSTATLINSTLSGNKTSGDYSTIQIGYQCELTMTNSVIWNNQADNMIGTAGSSLSTDPTGSYSISYSLVQGQTPAGTGNLDGITYASSDNYPGFVTPFNPASAPGTGGDFHLQGCSPIADLGTGAGAPATDLDGAARPFGAAVDLGCFERQSASTPTTLLYADADGDTYGNPGASILSCGPQIGYVVDNTDCNDGNAAINPAATEVCDGIDNDCDGNTDEGTVCNDA
ncbi:MAG: hypothetical protein JNK77_14455, partial [Saprospiraceae bacterium]|nr:hypothetical protein [Saprospiraceae bacterium]